MKSIKIELGREAGYTLKRVNSSSHWLTNIHTNIHTHWHCKEHTYNQCQKSFIGSCKSEESNLFLSKDTLYLWFPLEGCYVNPNKCLTPSYYINTTQWGLVFKSEANNSCVFLKVGIVSTKKKCLQYPNVFKNEDNLQCLYQSKKHEVPAHNLLLRAT